MAGTGVLKEEGSGVDSRRGEADSGRGEEEEGGHSGLSNGRQDWNLDQKQIISPFIHYKEL